LMYVKRTVQGMAHSIDATGDSSGTIRRRSQEINENPVENGRDGPKLDGPGNDVATAR
jgi:hypothetical protein